MRDFLEHSMIKLYRKNKKLELYLLFIYIISLISVFSTMRTSNVPSYRLGPKYFKK